jgi:hypothetical protein
VIHDDPARHISEYREREIVFKERIGDDSGKLIESVRATVGLHGRRAGLVDLKRSELTLMVYS